MKAIVAYTNEEYTKMLKKYNALRSKVGGHPKSVLFDGYTRRSGYAHYTFSGCVSNKLVELLGRMPDSDEIIMIVDGGFSHFGATCSLNGRRFSGRVNTD